jgi:hypothetical protein
VANAGISHADDAGRFRDSHSVRHSTGSLHGASRAHPKIVQAILRHSSIELSMNRYTHFFRGQESKAVANLSDLSLPSKEKQKAVATGTDNKSNEAVQHNTKDLTPKRTPFLTSTAFSGCNRMETLGN